MCFNLISTYFVANVQRKMLRSSLLFFSHLDVHRFWGDGAAVATFTFGQLRRSRKASCDVIGKFSLVTICGVLVLSTLTRYFRRRRCWILTFTTVTSVQASSHVKNSITGAAQDTLSIKWVFIKIDSLLSITSKVTEALKRDLDRLQSDINAGATACLTSDSRSCRYDHVTPLLNDYRAMHLCIARYWDCFRLSVRLSICLSVCNDQVPWRHRLEFFKNNFTSE